jgi:hypothetical protein
VAFPSVENSRRSAALNLRTGAGSRSCTPVDAHSLNLRPGKDQVAAMAHLNRRTSKDQATDVSNLNLQPGQEGVSSDSAGVAKLNA